MAAKTNLTAEDMLVTREFFFLMQHNDTLLPHGSTQDLYNVEFVLYRVKDGQVDPAWNAYSLRSWVQPADDVGDNVESPYFQIVYGQRIRDHNGDTTKVSFDGPLVDYPDTGCSADQLPALVIVKGLHLEPDREYVGYARVHDGLQFGQWARVAQTRLDFVKTNDKQQEECIRDLPFSDPKPVFSARLIAFGGSATRLPRNNPWAHLKVTIPGWAGFDDPQVPKDETCDGNWLPVENVKVNGKAAFDTGGDVGSTWIGSNATEVLLTSACERIEITAENALGNKYQLVNVFRPVYDSTGRVQEYVARQEDFEPTSAPDNGTPFRLRFRGIPYHLPRICEEWGTTPNPILVGVMVGDGHTEVPVFPVKNSSPDLGPAVDDPSDIALDLAKDTAKVDKVIVSVQVQGSFKQDPTPVPVMAEIDQSPEATWEWESDPIYMMLPSKAEKIPSFTNPVIMSASPGMLVVPFVAVSGTGSSAGADGESDDESGRQSDLLCGPLSVAAGVGCMAAVPQVSLNQSLEEQSLKNVKNGDQVQFWAYSILACPRASLRVDGQHNHADDVSDTPDYELLDGSSPQSLTQLLNSPPGAKLHLHNLTDLGSPDNKGKREDGRASDSTQLSCDPKPLEDNRQDAGGNNAAGADGSSSDGTQTCPPPPGHLHTILMSPSVTLMTQDYRMVPLATSHQLLPNGYLAVDLTDTDKKVSVTHTVRALDILKRWEIGISASPQASPNQGTPRTGGPSTHRVQGINRKTRDGSVYVHNGELEQRSEDLHITGTLLDLTFTRTHLSHSLFASPLGRNWDYIGNSRAVEMTNGDVMVMDGEGGFLYFKACRAKISPIKVEALKAATSGNGSGFDYSSVYKQAIGQYAPPQGHYRCLLKAKPVDLPGADKAGDDRLYLVDKHGMVMTFTPDQRFMSDTTAEPLGGSHDPDDLPAGVKAQYLLSTIHHRVQSSYLTLVRNAFGLVEGIVDDKGRVTAIDYENREGKASADHFISDVKDFAGRKVHFEHQARNLHRVEGPETGSKEKASWIEYGYEPRWGCGPYHKLISVSAAGDLSDTPFLRVNKRDLFGRVTNQTVTAAGNREATGAAPEVVAIYNYSWSRPWGGWGTVDYTETAHFPSKTKGGPQSVTNSERYRIRQEGDFLLVAEHIVHLKRTAGKTIPADAVTKYVYNDHAEIQILTRPKNNSLHFDYTTSGSQVGNLIRAWSDGTDACTHFAKYNECFNLPETIVSVGYTDNNTKKDLTAERHYDSQGNLQWETQPGKPKLEYTYFDNGQIKLADTVAGAKTRYYYYQRENTSVLGDAWDLPFYLAGVHVLDTPNTSNNLMLALAPWSEANNEYPDADFTMNNWFVDFEFPCVKKTRPARLDNINSQLDVLKKIQAISGFPGYDTLLPSHQQAIKSVPKYANGMFTTLQPSLLGFPHWVAEPDGAKRLTFRNDLGLVLHGPYNDHYTYEWNQLTAMTQQIPGSSSGPASASASSGQVTTSAPSGKVTTSAPSGKVTTSAPSGKVTTSAPSGGYPIATTSYSWDTLGNLLSESTAKLTTYHLYDMDGQVVQTIDPRGITTIFTYDERGLLLKKAIRSPLGSGPAGSSTEYYQYDLNGNMISHIDPCGWAEAWSHDTADRVVTSMNRRGLIASLEYGYGDQVFRETRYEAAGLTAHNSAGVGQAIPTPQAETQTLQNRLLPVAQRIAAGKWRPESGELTLGKTEFWHDDDGRIWKEVMLWAPVAKAWWEWSFTPNKTATVTTYYNDRGLVQERDLLSDGEIGPNHTYAYDSLGRIVLQFDGGCCLFHKYGAYGIDAATQPDDSLAVSAVFTNNDDYDLHLALSRLPDVQDFVLERKVVAKTGQTLGHDKLVCLNEGEKALDETPTVQGIEAVAGITVHKESFSYDNALRPSGSTSIQRRGVKAADNSMTPDPAVRRDITYKYDEKSGVLNSIEDKDAGGTRIRKFDSYGVFGPKTVSLAKDSESLQLETNIGYDWSGRKIGWTDANSTIFNVACDAEGQPLSLLATNGATVMHRRLIRRDALGRPVLIREQEEAYYGNDKAEQSTDMHVQPVIVRRKDELRSAVQNTYAYDTLGNVISETQSLPGLELPDRTTRYTPSVAGARRTIALDGQNLQLPANESTVVYGLDSLHRVNSASIYDGTTAPKQPNLVTSLGYMPGTTKITHVDIPSIAGGTASGGKSFPLTVQWSCNAHDYKASAALPSADMVRRYNDTPHAGWHSPVGMSGLVTKDTLTIHTDEAHTPILTYSHSLERAVDTYTKDGTHCCYNLHSWVSDSTSTSWTVDDEYSSTVADESGTVTGRRHERRHQLHPAHSRPTPGQGAYGHSMDITRSAVSRIPAQLIVTPSVRGADTSSHSGILHTNPDCNEQWPLKYLPSEVPQELPGAHISVDVFGRPVKLSDWFMQQHTMFIYDGLNRPIVKDLPANISIPPGSGDATIVLYVGPEPRYICPTGVLRIAASATDAAAIMIDICKSNPGTDFRIMVGADCPDMEAALNMLADETDKWRVEVRGKYDFYGQSTDHLRLLGRVIWESSSNVPYSITCGNGLDRTQIHYISTTQDTRVVKARDPVRRPPLTDIEFHRLHLRTCRLSGLDSAILDGCYLDGIDIGDGCGLVAITNSVFSKTNTPMRISSADPVKLLVSHNLFTGSDGAPIKRERWVEWRDDGGIIHGMPQIMELGGNVYVLNNLYAGAERGIIHANNKDEGKHVIAACNYPIKGDVVGVKEDVFAWHGAVYSKCDFSGLGGLSDVPGKAHAFSPVTADALGVIRDVKNPVPGPWEFPRAGTSQRVVHRYVHEAGRPLLRETYRQAGQGVWPDMKKSATSFTRFIRTVDGTGPSFYLDSDGTIDAFVPDCFGQPWIFYRAREGRPTPDKKLDTNALQDLRGTGLLTGNGLPTWRLLDYSPWFLTAIEPDLLLGRRGVFGWDGLKYDKGTTVDRGLFDNVSGWWANVEKRWAEDPWATVGYMLAGAALIAAGVAVSLFSAGALSPLGAAAVTAGLAMAGITVAAVGAATHDLGQTAKAGAIAGIATAAAVYTAGTAYEFLAGYAGLTGVAAAPGALALPPAMQAGSLAALAATAAVEGLVGYVGGMTYGLMQDKLSGKSWHEALATGHEYGSYGMVVGAATPWAGAIVGGILRRASTPGGFGKQLLRTVYEKRKGFYEAMKDFRLRWPELAKWKGHHVVPRYWWKDIFPQGSTGQLLTHRLLDSGINILPVPALLHRIIHFSPAAEAAFAGLVVYGTYRLLRLTKDEIIEIAHILRHNHDESCK